MMVSRRAFGLGLLGAGAAATGGYVFLRDSPDLQWVFGRRSVVFGFAGGEKSAFLADEEVVSLLGRRGLALDARTAGSVEMVREKALLSQKPAFLWPSSSIMVELARENGVAVRRDQVVFNSPIVIYSWQPIVDALIGSGLVTKTVQGHHLLDLKPLLEAVVAGKDWASLGVSQLFGNVRMTSTDPNRSNSGFLFAGLVLNLFAGEVAQTQGLARHGDAVRTIFSRMGFKSYSSGKLFEQYLAGGPGAEPLTVGYENQLAEWVLADPERWRRVSQGSGPQPVTLYPKPTVFSAHPFIVIDETADSVLDVLMSSELQALAWNRHGFRGPLGASAGNGDALLADLLPAEIDAVMPIPSAGIMLKLVESLSAP